MSTLLVIGGSGFFGKSILDAYWRDLLEPWGIKKVIVMARNATTTLKNYPELICPSNISPKKKGGSNRVVELLDADICTCTLLPFAEYVIHAAASTDARDYLSGPQIERENIQKGVSNFCDLAKIYLRKSKILYVSSGAVYGQQPKEVLRLKEDAPLLSIESLPLSKQDYAAAKRDAEVLMKGLGDDGLYVVIARCFAFVGKYLPRNQHFAIGNFIEDAISRRSITVKARNFVYRSYMYADDLVEWLLTILESANPLCPIVNVGSNQKIEIADLAILIAKEYKTTVNDSNNRSLIVDRYIPSIRLAESMGCKLKFDLIKSIKSIKSII